MNQLRTCRTLKLITLHDPYGTGVALRLKKIETREWPVEYRGPVAIHVAKGGLSQGLLETVCFSEHIFEGLDLWHKPFREWNSSEASSRPRLAKAGVFPFGKIIAVANLIDCRPLDPDHVNYIFKIWPGLDTPRERAFGNYGPGRWGFVFDDVTVLPDPVPFKSRQAKLLDVYGETLRQIQVQVCGYCGGPLNSERSCQRQCAGNGRDWSTTHRLKADGL